MTQFNGIVSTIHEFQKALFAEAQGLKLRINSFIAKRILKSLH